MRRTKKQVEEHKLHVRTGDKVVVVSGKDKGKTGNVKKVVTSENKVVVEGVNMVTRAQKPNPMAGIQGGLVKKEAPMDSSKVRGGNIDGKHFASSVLPEPGGPDIKRL